MERLDADLLELAQIDRDIGTIWFLYNRPLTTRMNLLDELRRLEDLGWIERTPKDRWLITNAGSKALSTAINWAFQVDQIYQDKEPGRQAMAIGRLLAGSMAYFAHPHSNGFTIDRSGAPEKFGWVESVRPPGDPKGTYLLASFGILRGWPSPTG